MDILLGVRRSWDENMAKIKNVVQALMDENPSVRRRASSKSLTGSETDRGSAAKPTADNNPKSSKKSKGGNNPDDLDIRNAKTLMLGECALV